MIFYLHTFDSVLIFLLYNSGLKKEGMKYQKNVYLWKFLFIWRGISLEKNLDDFNYYSASRFLIEASKNY